MLKKIGDTLGVLGLDKARGQIQRETQELAAIVASGKVLDQSGLEKIAATLLDVEDTLDRELVRAVMPGDEAEAAEERATRTRSSGKSRKPSWANAPSTSRRSKKPSSSSSTTRAIHGRSSRSNRSCAASRPAC